MGTNPICERCGLREVRRELERNGIVLRFCDYCYWGEVEPQDRLGEQNSSRAEDVPAEQTSGTPVKTG